MVKITQLSIFGDLEMCILPVFKDAPNPVDINELKRAQVRVLMDADVFI